MQTGWVQMLTGFQTIKTGNKRNVNVFRRFDGKPLMYVFSWKVTYNFEGIRFQQAHSTIACLQFDHILTNLFRVKLHSVQFFMFYYQFSVERKVPFIWSSPPNAKITFLFGNNYGFSSGRHNELLTHAKTFHRAFTAVDRNCIQISLWQQDILYQAVLIFIDTLLRKTDETACKMFEICSLKIVLLWLTFRLWHSESSSTVRLFLHPDWMILKNASNQRGVNSWNYLAHEISAEDVRVILLVICDLSCKKVPYNIRSNGWMHGKQKDKKRLNKPFDKTSLETL